MIPQFPQNLNVGSCLLTLIALLWIISSLCLLIKGHAKFITTDNFRRWDVLNENAKNKPKIDLVMYLKDYHSCCLLEISESPTSIGQIMFCNNIQSNFRVNLFSWRDFFVLLRDSLNNLH